MNQYFELFNKFKKNNLYQQNSVLYFLEHKENSFYLDLDKIPRNISAFELKKIIQKLVDENFFGQFELSPEGNRLIYKENFLFAKNSELSPNMKKEAVLRFFYFCKNLISQNKVLINVLSTSSTVTPRGVPFFIDFVAIAEKGPQNFFAFRELMELYLNSIVIIQKNSHLASEVQKIEKISMPLYFKMAPTLFRFFYKIIPPLRQFGSLVALSFPTDFNGLLKLHSVAVSYILKRKVKKIKLLDYWIYNLNKLKIKSGSTKWSAYHHQPIKEILTETEWKKYFISFRSKVLFDLLSSEPRGTLLDIGANKGFFSCLGAKFGYKVTAIDYDVKAIDELFLNLKATNFVNNIRPLVVNFSELKEDELWRFRSDVVLALGFIHHMRLVEYISWDKIAEKLSLLTDKTLITDFKLTTVARGEKEEFSALFLEDYKLDNYVTSLKKYFNSVELLEITKQDGVGGERQMVICRK